MFDPAITETTEVEPPIISLEEMAKEALIELGLPYKSDPGWTREEWQEKWGCTKAAAIDRLKKLKNQGKIIEGRRIVRDKANRPRYDPVYLLKRDKDDEISQTPE